LSRVSEILDRRNREGLAAQAAKPIDRTPSAREQRRVAMPIVASFVDAMREHFPDLHVLYATENGHVWGTPQPKGLTLKEIDWHPQEKA
jgi:hypothetical protein